MRKLLSIAIVLLLFVSPAEAVLLFGDNSTQTSEDFIETNRAYGDEFTASAATGTYENVVIYVRWGSTNAGAKSKASIYDDSENLLATGAEDTGTTDGIAESYAVSGTLAITNGATYRIGAAIDTNIRMRHDGTTNGEYDGIANYAAFPPDPFSVTGTSFGEKNYWVEGDLVAVEETETAKKVILVAVTG